MSIIIPAIIVIVILIELVKVGKKFLKVSLIIGGAYFAYLLANGVMSYFFRSRF